MKVSSRACRGPGSLDAEAYCIRLAGQGKYAEAVAAAELHNRIAQRSPIRLSDFYLNVWRGYAKELADA